MWNLPEVSEESLLKGNLTVYQPAKGYRFSLEVFLLAGFVRLKPGEIALELGAGCGVISLILFYRNPLNRIIGLEIQKELVACFAKNVKRNNFSDGVFPVCGDVKKLPFKAGAFQVVFANPPYYPLGTGRLSPDPQERIARHEILATLSDFLSAAALALRNRGRFYLIHGVQRLPEILYLCQEKGFAPKTLRVVHSYPEDEGRLILLEAVKAGGQELRILPPLFVYTKKGGPYTDEVARLFAP
ncbi:tRNA1(Val) (adenine(37)-N6)-methyltransferase [Thermodesulfatator atlanticus]|uniref:tRNA1(Val) (adenine(37)-N6)-methyltransferase n=1 Tax=Thermodesulfatator atlanticus TaxID=501497 RepID=UPI0003B54EF1|nr:methyltransferase domain-containing protein [Thermodesulfatator atlanticus]